MFSNSLKPLNEMFIFPPRIIVEKPTLDNFRDLFNVLANTMVPLSRYLFNSFVVVTIGSLGHICFASMCAFPLAKYRFPGSKLISSLIVYSLMFNTTVTMVPNFITVSKLGLIDSLSSIIIPGFASTLGLYLMKNFMEQIPDSLLESAQIDGAGYFRMLWSIAMPIVKPAYITAFILVFHSLWSNTGDKFIYTEKLKGFAYLVFQLSAGAVSGVGVSYAGIVAASAVIMFIIPVAVFLIMQSNVISTMATSGMKE
jgi:ABC-type glycerol-3-phosphate transport system permease component